MTWELPSTRAARWGWLQETTEFQHSVYRMFRYRYSMTRLRMRYPDIFRRRRKHPGVPFRVHRVPAFVEAALDACENKMTEKY